MRATLLTLLVLAPALVFSSCNDKKDSGSGGGGGAKEEEPVTAGTLAVVTGTIQPAEGADVSTVAGALVEAEGHPEISAVTDENGNFGIENVLPGTIALYVGSNDGGAAALKLEEGKGIGPTAYGLKIPDIVLKSGEVTDLGEQPLKKTGGFSGKVTFYSNPNKLDLTGSEVFVPGTGFIVKTDATGAFSLGGLPPGKYDLRVQHTGFAVLDLKGVEIAEGATTSLGEVALSLSTGPEGTISLVDAPEVKIGAEMIPVVTDAKRATKFKLTYDSDAALMKISDEPSFINKEWQSVAASGTWNDFKTDGRKSLYVMFSDLNGLESSPNKVEFIIDSLPPSEPSLKILNNWDQLFSGAASMRATVGATDQGTGVEKMMICTTNNFESCGSWVDYSSDAAGIAVSTNAYVKFKDYVNHVSAVASDSIILGSHTIISGGTYAGDLRLHVEQSPYRFDSAFTVNGNLTIDAGVTLDHANVAKITVKGKLTAVGKSNKKITLTASTPFAGFDLSDSPADDNEVRYFVVGTGGLMTAPFIKMNGGTLANNEITSSSNTVFVEKVGYKAITIKDNELEYAKITITGGNATTISGNTLTSNYCPAVNLAGDTDMSHNSLTLVCDGSGSANDTVGISVTAGDLNMSNNDMDMDGNSGMMSATSNAVAIKNTSTGTLTLTHNNFDLDNSGEPTQLRHVSNYDGSSIADYNYYAQDGSPIVPTVLDNDTADPQTNTDTNVRTIGPWATTGSTDCVGSGCD